ncbi:MAG: hypothetical protein P1V35_06590 [Planctomycetota bacterium]|nr:hypothetical protein [Planctomycetota bacterium]
MSAGAATFAILDKNGSKNSKEWAAAVAVGTFVVSEWVQNELEERRAKHESESEFLDSEIAIAEESIGVRQSELDANKELLAKYRNKVDSLERQEVRNEAHRVETEKALAEVRATVAKLDADRAIIEKEIEIYSQAAESSKAIADASVTEEELAQRRTTLIAKRDERLAQYKLLVADIEETTLLGERLAVLR